MSQGRSHTKHKNSIYNQTLTPNDHCPQPSGENAADKATHGTDLHRETYAGSSARWKHPAKRNAVGWKIRIMARGTDWNDFLLHRPVSVLR